MAFLDGGADCHLIRRDLHDELGLIGDPVKSKIGLADGTTAVEETYVTNLLVRGLGDAAAAGTYKLTSVIVKEELADVGTSAPTPEDFERNAHLVNVEIPFFERDKIEFVIGLNARILHEIHDEWQDQMNFVQVVVFRDGFCMETMLQLITWRRVIGPEVLVLLLLILSHRSMRAHFPRVICVQSA